MAHKKRISKKKRKQRSKLLKYDGLKEVNVVETNTAPQEPASQEPASQAPASQEPASQEPKTTLDECRAMSRMEMGFDDNEEPPVSKCRNCRAWVVGANLIGLFGLSGGLIYYLSTK